jgi:hypothetical protein
MLRPPAEKRRRAVRKAKLARSKKDKTPSPGTQDERRPELEGWDVFEREGLLR